jgi:hypothetical protein
MTRFLTALLLACLASAQAADITLAVPSTAQSIGSTYTVTVQVANAGPFANWGAYVTFDKTKVQLTTQAAGTFATFVQDSRGLAAINAAGDVRTGGFGLADNAGGSGTLAVLTFQVIGAGSASFATAAKSGATPFGCVLTNASGTDTLPTIPAPSTVVANGLPLTITVNNATRAFGDANPAFSVTYAGFQGADNAASMTGTLAFTTAATPASNIGTYPVTASGLSHPNYTITYVAGTLTVSPAATAITWANPSAITYGTALSATQLNASTGGVAGSYVYTPAAGAVLHAGTQTLQVAFTPASGNYLASTGTASLVVSQAPLTVSANPASRAFGLANPVFTPTYLGFVNGDTAAVIDVAPTLSCAATTTSALGTYPITVSGGSDVDYTFTRVDGVLTVTGATPVLTWATPAAITYGTALSATQLNATANTPGTFVYNPASGAVLGAGTQSLAVTFTPTDAVNYSTATATVSLTVNQAAQTIAGFSAFGTRTYGDAAISLAGVTGGASTMPVAFASSDLAVATVSGSTVTIVGSGSAVITASQAGDANFTAATAVPQTLTVGKAALSVTAANATRAVGTANPVFTGTLTGVVAGDAITATYASTATAATPVGTYGPTSPEAITPTLVDPGSRLGHYTVTSTKGTLSVVAGLAVIITRSGSGTPNVASHPAETITVTFSEAVTGFVDGELTLTGGGTLGTLAGSGAVYTATWTPPVGSEGTATFAVAAGVATGASLNNLAGSLAVGYDTLAPGAATITAPLAGATVGGAFTASGTLPSGATALSINGLSATVTGSAWTRAFSGLTSGALALTAHALDAAGNVGPDVVVNVTVDYSPPALTVASLATPSASRIQVLTGTTDDAAVTITVFDGATLIATQPSAGLAWSATSAALADGVHSLTVTATDTLGNATTSAAIPLTVDATGPVANFAAPSAFTVKPGDTVTVPVTYSDAISSVAAITLVAGNVSVTATGTATAAATVSGSGLSTRTITLSGISGDGTLRLSLAAGTAVDTLGNLAAAASSSSAITVATPVVAVPVLPISSSGQAAALAAASSGSSDKKLLGCGMGSGLGLIAGACALLMLSLRRRRD